MIQHDKPTSTEKHIKTMKHQYYPHYPTLSYSTLKDESKDQTNTLWKTKSLLLKMAIERADLPIKHCDVPLLCGCLPEGKSF